MKNYRYFWLDRILISLALSASLVACSDDGDTGNDDVDAAVEEEVDAPPAGLQVTAVEGGNFIAPESVRWDADNQYWYVANFGEALGEPDEPGWITRLDANGAVVDERWVDMQTPLGMALLNGSLYVADSGNIVVIDVATGTISETIPVPDAMFLNDVASGNGQIYVSDTVADAIYSYTPGGQPELLIQDVALDGPNGLYVRADDLVIASFGDLNDSDNDKGRLLTYTFADGSLAQLGNEELNFDGIEPIGDGFLVTDFTGILYRVMADGSAEAIADFVADHGLQSTADLGFDPQRNMVAIPDLIGNQVVTFTLP